MGKIIKVVVIDDQTLVRHGIVGLLNGTSDICVVGEADRGEDAIQIVREHNPDVVLMDLQMPGMGGLGATRKLLQVFNSLKILILTVCESDVYPIHLLKEGVFGYITKDSAPDEVFNAIRSVHSGTRYISPEIAQKLALKRFAGESTPFDCLSERELQVMIMISKGKKVQEIADMLHLSPKTVNTYRYRLFEKLGVKSDVELTHLALKYDVIDNK